MATTNIKEVNLKIGTETQFNSKLKDLPINTLVGTTDPIQESELDSAIITKLSKAENALPKPTNDTTGSTGQVLKKTASGSAWSDIDVGTVVSANAGDTSGGLLDSIKIAGTGYSTALYTHIMTFSAGGYNVSIIKLSRRSSQFDSLDTAYTMESEQLSNMGYLIPIQCSMYDGSGSTHSVRGLDLFNHLLYIEDDATIDIGSISDFNDTVLANDEFI